MAKSYDYLFKILLIGDSGVGKTCILCRFANNEFNRSHISTIGIDFKMKTIIVEGKRIRIQMWDTAGQERYETITTQYYRRAHNNLLFQQPGLKSLKRGTVKVKGVLPEIIIIIISGVTANASHHDSSFTLTEIRDIPGIILVYDITRQETFNNIRKWLRYVDEHANNNVQRLLLANKCDAEDERRVWKDQGARLAAEKSIKFYETSAQSNINIDEAFTEICRQILQTMSETEQNGRILSATGEVGSSAILLDTKNEVLHQGSCCQVT